jgi:hypothetical protein
MIPGRPILPLLLLFYSLALNCQATPGICNLEKLLPVSIVLHISSERVALLGVLSVLGCFGHVFRFTRRRNDTGRLGSLGNPRA